MGGHAERGRTPPAFGEPSGSSVESLSRDAQAEGLGAGPRCPFSAVANRAAEAASLTWDPSAEKRLERVPDFLPPVARQGAGDPGGPDRGLSEFSPDREPPGGVGRRATPLVLRGVHPRCPHVRHHRRVYRLGGGGEGLAFACPPASGRHANLPFGGAIVAAYAAFRFLGARTDEERAQYDWMGYVGNFVAVSSLLFLPFAGYWLGREIYAFNQTLGITMMGGVLSWLLGGQAVLIGVLFVGSNYYLWLGMERIPGSERYRPYIPYLVMILAAGFIVWATPRSMVATLEETRAMGGTHHPVLGVLGVMSAKNTAVNLMILTTFVSFLLYRRANRVATVSWVRSGMTAQWIIMGVAAV